MSRLAELLGDSAAIELVRRNLCRLIERQREGQRLPPVLIQGDTGTGKGLVARTLHREGARAKGPFIDVNCAAIPETLLEAELFGFERGAFTDAHRPKPGLFQAAHRGMLFLDEVGLLPDSVQAKLLTAIEERAVRRLGSTVSEATDTWLISASNTDLSAAVRARKFREDLYHRLAVVTIDLPPLRERGRDIVLLAERFLTRACLDYRLPTKRLDAGAHDRLLAYSWPGNVRELANVMERAALFADGTVITADALGVPAAAPGRAPSSALPVGRHELTQQRLRTALEETGWNISHTAARLGVARNTVYARLAKFGLKPSAVVDTPGAGAGAEERVAPPHTALRWEQRAIGLLRAEVRVSDGVDACSQSSRAIESILAKVQTFGGRLEELSPTGLIASFGVEPCDDAPRRAATAALAIQKNGQRSGESGEAPPLASVGLHVASLVIGRVGMRIEISADDKRVHWPTLDALIRDGKPGDTSVSAAAEPFLDRRFELIENARASDTAAHVYQLTGRERDGLALWGSATRFVGRQDELAALHTRFRMAASGQGQVVALMGEAGVGKSRLVFELARSPHLGECLVLQTGSASYAKGSSYFPAAGLLRRYFGIQDRDTHGAIRDRVSSKLAALEPALLAALPALLMLLDIDSDDSAWQQLDPSQRRRRAFDAVKAVLRRESEMRPIVAVFEDLHWIDSETQALLDAIVGSVPTMRLLLVVTYRPEYQHGWAGHSYYSLLSVDPLPPAATQEFLGALLGNDAALEPLKHALAVKTGHNPLFIEETVRALVETDVFSGQRGAYSLARPVTAIEVPATVQAILAARIERLPAGDKRLLEMAAVIGKDVPFALLRVLAEEEDREIRDRLGRLETAEFLYETRAFVDAEYTFKHALTHDAAYETVPPVRRRALHARIAAAIEDVYAGRLTEHVERLAHHSVKAELWQSAVRYLREAAAKAARQHALRDAAAWFEQALSALSHVAPDRAALEQAVDIRIERSPLIAALGDYGVAQAHVGELAELAQQLGDELRCGFVCRFQQNIANHAGRLDDALAWGTRALEVAGRLGDRPLRIAATTMLEQTQFMRGEYQLVVDLAHANLAALTRDDEQFDHFPRSVDNRGWLVRSLAEMGRFGEAARPATAAREIAERLQHPYAIAWACYAASSLHNWMGRWDVALVEAEHARDVLLGADYASSLADVTALSAWIHARLARSQDAVTRARDAESLLDVSRAQARIAGNSWSWFWLSRTFLLLGQVEDAERALARVLEPPAAAAEAHAAYLRGEIAAHPLRSQHRRSEECYGQARMLAGKLAMRPLAAHCHIGLTRLFTRTDRPDEAMTHLRIATTMCRDLDMEPWLRC